MTWLRIDDHEALDSRIGELDDSLYRARHALMQLCAREYRDTGIFPAGAIVHATYATPKGPRALTRRGLEKLLVLGIVRRLVDYTNDELFGLDLERTDDENLLRIHRWERYNPPRDRTAAERKRREREATKTAETSQTDVGVTDAVTPSVTDMSRRDTPVTSRPGHGPSHAGTRARSRPVPSPEEPEGPASAAEPPKTQSAPNNAPPDEKHQEPAADQPSEKAILDACRRFGADRDIVLPLADQLPPAVFAQVVAKVAIKTAAGNVRDVPALFVDLLKRETKTLQPPALTIVTPPPAPPPRQDIDQALEQLVASLAPRHPEQRVAQAVGEFIDEHAPDRRPELVQLAARWYDHHRPKETA